MPLPVLPGGGPPPPMTATGVIRVSGAGSLSSTTVPLSATGVIAFGGSATLHSTTVPLSGTGAIRFGGAGTFGSFRHLTATGAIDISGSPTLLEVGGVTLTATGVITVDGMGALHMIVPPSPPPSPPAPVAADVYFWRRNIAMATPTLVNGIPTNWADGAGVASDSGPIPWGRVRILIGGTDVSFFRGVASVVENYIFSVPYGDLSCLLRFPQISFFDTLGSGDLAWFVPGANIELDWVHPDESFTPPGDILWEGILEPVQHKRGEELTGTGLQVTGIGALQQLGFYRRAPGLSVAPIDIGQLLGFQWNLTSRPALRTVPPVPVTTGVLDNYRGNWESALEYCTKLSQENTDDTGKYWTCMKKSPRTVVITQLGPPASQTDMSLADYHMAVGQPGCAVDLTQEYTTATNVVYGEGIDLGGQTWRNMYTDGEAGTGIPFFQPLAYDPEVHPYDPGPNGTLVAVPGRVNPAIIRQESYQGKGQGVSYAEGVSSAQTTLALLQDTGWSGTVTLTADPEEPISRLQMVAGKVLGLRYFDGTGVNLFISQCEVDVGDGESGASTAPQVILTVDSKARNLPTLADVIARNRALVQNPTKRYITGKDSGLVLDKVALWDGVRSGWVPNGGQPYDVNFHPRGPQVGFRWANNAALLPCPGRQWTFLQFLASELDTIVSSTIVTSPINSFVAAIFDQPPDGNSLPVNPTANGADATLRAATGYIIHWGNPDQIAGFSPGLQSNGDPVTGVLNDDAQWAYTHNDLYSATLPNPNDPKYSPAFLWLAVWPVAQSDGVTPSTGTNLWAQFTRLATV